MRKTVSILFAFALVVSLGLAPAMVLAQDPEERLGGLAVCEQEPLPKWFENEPSYFLYLQNWGRTPIQAMSRLAGLCGPEVLCQQLGTNCPPSDCGAFAGCPACRVEEQGATATCDDPVKCDLSRSDVACKVTAQTPPECPGERVLDEHLTTCCCCWGVSLAFANKSWAGCTISTHPRVNDQHPNHFGTSDCYGGNKGGDWGVSGCPHTECCSLTWCLQDNLCANPLANK